MAENTPEFNSKEEQWKYAQSVAADAIEKTGVGNEDVTAPETVVDQGEKEERAFAQLLTAETAFINNLGGNTGSEDDQQEGGGKLRSIKEFMDKHPRVKQLATAFLVSSTLGMAACANSYDAKVEQEKVELAGKKSEIDIEHEQNVRIILETKPIEEQRDLLVKEHQRWRKATIKAEGRSGKEVSDIGVDENKDIIREEERSGRRVEKSIEKNTTRSTETVVDGIFGKGSERSRSKKLGNAAADVAGTLAVEGVRGALRGLGIGR